MKVAAVELGTAGVQLGHRQGSNSRIGGWGQRGGPHGFGYMTQSREGLGWIEENGIVGWGGVGSSKLE